jgi:hypothetical protein
MRYLYRHAIAAIILVSTAACSPSSAPGPEPVAMEKTIAFELLRLEAGARKLPPEAERRLRSLLRDAYDSLGPDPRPPENADEFRAFAEKVTISLAGHNQIQPVDPADWVSSLGEALQPVSSDHPRLARILDHGQNKERRRHVKPGEPFHFLDCDIASLLLMSVAQMVGFELKLVEVPRHNFVRWSDGRGEYANWDWTNWGSRRNEYYTRNWSMTELQRNRRLWLTSQSAAESRGYFIGALTAIVSDPAQRLQLVREAVKGAPNHPIVAETAAWVFATNGKDVTDEERSDAVTYALTALAANPDNAGYTLTAACAFAVGGSADVAAALRERAASLDPSDASENFRANLESMERGHLCRDRSGQTDPDGEEE